MTKLRISNDFALPADFASMTSAVLGIRGSGKTTTAAVAFEELLSINYQVIAIDPTDVWHGLKSSADGKRPGFQIVVLGGPHGDLPIDAASGSTIADFLVEHRASAVLSLRHLRKADQRRFVTDFAERFYFRKGEAAHRTPVILAIDECDAFVPQHVAGGDARMVGAIEDLVRRGRACGIGVMLISQRAASINKDVLTQIELLIAHRHTSPQDRKALQLWIEAHDTANRQAEFMASLASLPIGTAWFWSPGWLDCFRRVNVRQRKTFDSSATPRPGQKVIAPKEIAQVDLDKLKEQLKSTIEQAAANDPKELKRQIAELKQQLAKQRPAADQKAIERAIDKAISENSRQWDASLKKIQRQYAEKFKDYRGRLGKIASLASVNGEAVEIEPTRTARAATPAPIAAPGPVINRPTRQATTTRRSIDSSSTLPAGERRVLTAVAQYSDAGGASREQLTILAGYKRSTRDAYLQRLRERGFIDQLGDSIIATDAGMDALGSDFEPLPTGDELREYWLARLPEGERKCLEVLIEHYPNHADRSELDEATGYKRSSRDAYLQRLQARKLIVANRGQAQASAELFD